MPVEKKEGKRKYGQPRPPQGEKALLIAKNKKMRQSQACDRCRLKKIKCDGMKPTCSQCTKVNFTCRTSDRLTRRGFPRGYTEMLESEVVRLQKILEGKGISVEITDENINSSNDNSGNDNDNDDSDIKPTMIPSTYGDYSQEEERSLSNTNGGGELEFPFVNDTFHYYDNYRRDENYMGNSTWNMLTGSLPAPPDEATKRHCETDSFINYQLSAMKNILQLDSNFLFLPRFLLVKYDYNLPKLVKLLRTAVADFGKFENSLVPILYPFDKWENDLLHHLIHQDASLSTIDTDVNPIRLLTLLYIIQLNWSCFNDFKLFQLTKMVCLSSKTKLETLQCILLASFYFMGGQTSSIIHHSSDNSQVWATELLHIAYSVVLNLGLYVNSKRMISIHPNWEISPQSHRVVTFWVFQFLDSWWTLLQGLPKSNFLVDEFRPQSVKSLNVPSLTPFTLLLNFTADSLDGCNLLHTLSGGHSNGKSKLVYVTESFRRLLVKWKLYHQIQDHEDDFDPDDDNGHGSTTLTKPDMVEIQLTLFYLIISFLSNEKFTHPNKGESSITATNDFDNTSLHGSNLEEIAYEILSLYSLVLMDHAKFEQPQQLKVVHLLPCHNRDIIRLCLTTLNNWVLAPGSNNDELKGQVHWKFDRYQSMINQWCRFYLVDKLHDPLLQQLIVSFKLNLNGGGNNNGNHGQAFYNWNEIDYLENVDMFNDNPQIFTKNQLLRSNPHAVMEQFDIFAPKVDGGRPIFDNIQPTTLQRQEQKQKQKQKQQNVINASNLNESRKPRSNISEHDSANIIDMSKHRSQILIANEETDDGYAEDDDDDDDNDKPLEIPLSRRTGSLFQRNGHKNDSNKLSVHRGNDRLRRHTLDHVFLGQVPQSDVNNLNVSGSNETHQEGLAPLQNGEGEGRATSSGTHSLENYALNANTNKRNRSQSISAPPNSDPNGALIPATSTTAEVVVPEQNDVLFEGFIDEGAHVNPSNHDQFVETPRALVDMLMLPPQNHQHTQVVNPSSTLTAGSSSTTHNGVYKQT
ncbi:hypothetical protein ZYGR_0AD03900 [Zygosaccharomyces rouxii]|uniref:Zn(2)-C6 fungal-type domain-containing protein n=1 Tax=Zygosaccharomyces rouxii TaxID=4956 RepID=A0A1Q3A6C4_ZYGRO|nr:hypothetical protein ZYGR_0AD03900 [Zygosaccharomyces rouxii]